MYNVKCIYFRIKCGDSLQVSRKTRRKIVSVVSAFFLLLVIGYFIGLLWPWRAAITDKTVRAEFEMWMHDLGFGGWILFIVLQLIQVIIAIIPGEPFEMLAGILFGSLGGLLSCLLGILLGSTLIFATVRKFGYPLVTSFYPEEKIRALPIFKKKEHLEGLILILFLIPGTPKDLLTYAAGLTSIEMKRFLLLSTFARIPSVITSVWVGAAVREGDWIRSLLLFLLTAGIGLLGIWIHKVKFADQSETN